MKMIPHQDSGMHAPAEAAKSFSHQIRPRRTVLVSSFGSHLRHGIGMRGWMLRDRQAVRNLPE
jgi:hypothetical protein